ncbi:MAG: hypothetical protein H7841_08465, partial [Magnetospirillum sp. WYHS-4]
MIILTVPVVGMGIVFAVLHDAYFSGERERLSGLARSQAQLEQWRGVLGEAPIENIGFFGLKSGPGEKCSGTFSLSL